MPGAISRIDRGLQNSYAWLDEVAAHIGGERRDAFRALYAVLTALRDRLPIDATLQLSNGMPLLIRGIFFDDFDPARHARAGHAKGFVATVEERLAAGAPVGARQVNQAIEAVLAALARHVDDRILGAIGGALPPEVRVHLVVGREAAETSRGPAPAAADA